MPPKPHRASMTNRGDIIWSLALRKKITSSYLTEVLIPALNRLGLKPVDAFDVYIRPETPSIYLLIPGLEAVATAEKRC